MKLVSFKNLGNTCYLNGILICFIYSPFFHEKIESSKTDSTFIKELKNIITFIDTSCKKDINTKYNLTDFIDYFISEKPWFKKFQQNDAHEFLVSFLDLLIKNTPTKFKITETDILWKKPWDTFLTNNSSPFTRHYHGQTKTTIKCCRCKTIKYIFEEFNSINLNIPLREQRLVDLFKDYLKKETNDDDDNLYYCEKCKTNTISLKKVSLNILPETLIVVLKRYSCTGTKILSEIEYPEKLSIKESSSSVIKNYQLNCIVNHVGNLFDGHYTTSTLIKNNWYYFDDDSIYLNNSLNKSNPNAYILIYSKVL